MALREFNILEIAGITRVEENAVAFAKAHNLLANVQILNAIQNGE